MLEELAGERVADFDGHAGRLEKLIQQANTEIAACFLGQAAVGKSTLINAVIAEGTIILPAGGVGPLTAQAIEIRYSEKPMFTVEYHGMQQFWRLVFALEQKLLRQKQDAVESDLKPELRDEDDQIVTDDTQVIDHLERQGRLIITGDQNRSVDLEYLVDCLRIAGSRPTKWNTNPTAEDSKRKLRLVRS